MTDLDGELEKLRAEVRHRIEGERELEEKLAAYKEAAPLPPETAPLEDVDSDEDDDEASETKAAEKSPSLGASLATNTAAETAKKAAKDVSAFSTPKLLVLLVAVVFAAWLIRVLVAPIVALAVLGIVVLLGYRFLRWLTSSAEDDGDGGGRGES